jgi:O-antigen/teichoic acid export membrane protein
LRARRIVVSVVTGLPAFGVQVVSGLLLVTFAWQALGADGFGVWAAITALGPLIALGDLGVSFALINLIATAVGRDDSAAVRPAVAMAIALSTAMALVLTAFFLAAYMWVDWPGWFNLPSDTPYAPGLAVLAYAACRLLLLPLGVVGKLRAGLQQNFVNNVCDAAGVLLSVGLFFVAWHLGASLPLLLLASGAGPVIAALGNWLGFSGSGVVPRARDFDMTALWPMLRLGVLFFVLNLATLLSSAGDNLVAIRLLGPTATAELAIASKIIAVGQAVLSVALMPLWPAFTEAIARRDGRWIRRALLFSFGASGAAGLLLSILFLVGANWAIALWLKSNVSLPADLLFANAAWLMLQAIGVVAAMFLNGASVVRFQIVQALFFGVVAFGLKLIIARRLNSAGIVWATNIAYFATELPFDLWFIRRWLARADWT